MIGRTVIALALAALMAASPAIAQTKPKPAPKPKPTAPRSRSVEIGGYAMLGRINFIAADSFDVILGSPSGTIVGGGARIGLPYGGLFVDVGAWRFHGEGERVFVSGADVFPLGVPLDITIIPIEISGGWRFQLRRYPKLRPYAAGGFTSYGYTETSQFATGTEDVEEHFSGFHLFGGAEYRVRRWLGVAGELAWTTVPDAIGESGVSEAFNETNLGGTSIRFKVTIGR
jgi:hypothetical protein